MNEWLLLLLVPLGAATLGQLFDDDDRDEPAQSQTEGTDGNDTLTAPEGYQGAVTGADGDDRIEVGSPDDPNRYNLRSIASPQWGSWGSAYDWDPEDTAHVPDGVVAARGDAGDDTIIGTGVGIDIDGGSGDDVVSLTSSDVSDDPNKFGAIARGGEGDDSLTVSGAGAVVLGGEGDDSFAVSGHHMRIDGGDGADVIDVTGLTQSSIALGAGDSLTGRGDGADGLRFLLREGADFTGNGSDERIELHDSARADGGGGNDGLSVLRGDSSTLIGGAGDDTLHARGYDNPGQSSWYGDLVGSSDDVLEGGAGSDLLLFDRADTVSGGAGADSLDGFVDSGQTAVVTDFTAGEDVLRLNLDPEESTEGEEAFGHVSITEQDGNTLIQVQGSDVARIEGATGLAVGFEISDTYSTQEPRYVDADGNEVDPASLDVIINRYERFDT